MSCKFLIDFFVTSRSLFIFRLFWQRKALLKNSHKLSLGTQIDSIPQALWWSINTYTTVGLGDALTITFPGKLVAVTCMFVGTVFMGLPIYCLVNNFLVFWNAMQHMDPSSHLVKKIMQSIRGLARMKSIMERKHPPAGSSWVRTALVAMKNAIWKTYIAPLKGK